MWEAIIGVFGTILVTLFGYWLSESSQNKKQAEEEKKQIRTVRIMMELEIDQNLNLLKKLLDDMTIDQANGNQDTLNAQKLLHMPFPSWNHSFFQSQLASIPKALTTDELRKVYSHHNVLDSLSGTRNLLSELQNEQNDSIANSNSEQKGISIILSWPRLTFSQNAGPIWAEFYKKADNLLKDGNILKTNKQ